MHLQAAFAQAREGPQEGAPRQPFGGPGGQQQHEGMRGAGFDGITLHIEDPGGFEKELG